MRINQAPAPVTDPWLPLSLAQHGVWLDVLRLDDPAAYQLGTATELEGDLDPDLARQAVRLIMARHDALRLRIDRDEPRQRFEATGEPPFHLTDLRGEADPDAAARAHIAAVQAAGFQLGDRPLFRVDLLRLGPRRWIMAIICHHLLGDGVSMALIQRHWAQAYATLTGEAEEDEDEFSETPVEPAPRSSYLPVILDDAAYAASPRYAEDLAYWRERLTPLPAPVLEDRARPDAAGEATAPVLDLDAATWARFEAAARAAGATTHRALVALLAVTLSRRYGREDLCLGMALHRRDLSTRHTIGMLAGMIAVRCKLDVGLTLRQAVERLAAGIDADLRHQRTPIDVLGRALGLAAQGRVGLFDVAITILPPSREAPPALPGVKTTSSGLRDPERTPLMLYAYEKPDRAGMTVRFGFDANALSVQEVERLKERLTAALTAFCATPDLPLAKLDRLTADERAVIAAAAQGPRLDVPSATLPDLFEAQAARTPEALAVVDETGELTYADLDAAADRVAVRLVEAEIGLGDVVGVAMSRSLSSVVALVGVLKAGAVYLPLDPAYPAARLAEMIGDSGARLILTNAEAVSVLPEGVATVGFDSAWPLTGAPVSRTPRDGLTPDARAYVIYTSGSTGRPKGVAMAHRAAVNLAYARLAHDPISPGDRVLAAISIGFDVSIGQLLLPLLHGASVVVAPELRGVSPNAFWGFMGRHRVTHVNSVPSFFDAMLDGAPEDARLTLLMLGGEALSGALARRLSARLNGTPVVNMYGPTETCIDATAFPVPSEGVAHLPVLPIGRPLPNYSVHVLDAARRPVGIGAVGELYIGGAGLAEGYVGSAELTAERFVEVPGLGRLYRTGDRTAWREDATVAFLGRGDTQVKIRGFRVEPGEVEAALSDRPGLAQAAVIARPDARGQMRLLAYVVAEPGQDAPTPEALRAHLERTLPAYMVPAAFTALTALPLTPNGKLDVRALPEPEAAATGPALAPRSDMERRLAGLYGELLDLTEVDIGADFFALGGHSLLATRLAARLRRDLNVELPIRTLFEAPRIIDLAPRVSALCATDARTEGRPPLTARTDRPTHPPLSFAQERLWFLFRLDPTSAAYNIPTVLRLDGALDVAAFQTAINALVARHETLRTRIVEIDGAPVQSIRPSLTLDVEIEDLAGREDEAVARATQQASRPFDLSRDDLIRVRLLRLSPTAHVVVLTLHHIISDGWSAGVLVREMALLYRAARQGAASPLPALAVQYADFALWQRDWLDGEALEAQADYWREALADAPEALALPHDRPRPAAQSFRGASRPVRLEGALAERLSALARSEQATPFIVLISAWSALLGRWSGRDDVVVGTPIANRTQAETEGLIGFFVNTLAMRADLSGQPSFRELVRRTRARALDAYAHQDLPFEKLVDALNPRRDLGRHPIFQVMFVLQTAAIGTLELPELAMTPLPISDATAKFDLTLTLTETAQGYEGEIAWASDLFDPATIDRLADQFVRLVEAAAADPDQELARIDLLDPSERARLLDDWSGTEAEAEIDTIPALFEAQVRRTPDAPAVTFQGRTLSYAKLNRRADRLARHLVAKGLGLEQPVGVALERSDALVVAALAVMKAGGAYLPLDPGYPADRLATMLTDSDAALVITSAGIAPTLPDTTPRLLLEAFGDEAPDESEFEPARPAGLTPQSIAYIIYTSGSTGRPKGVAMPHAGVANLAAARLRHDPIGPGARVLAALSVSFDVSVGQLLTPLLSGATVVVASELNTMSGAEFWRLLADEGVTHVNSGPSFIDAILDEAPAGLPLQRLMLGGEPLSTGLIQRLRRRLPGAEIFNMYGPTETCIDATCYRVSGEETGAAAPIGRPLPNYRAYILDGQGQPVGVGLVGELHIGGASLARGYLNRPDLTAERFILDPFGAAGGRLYRTGDLARWRADGQIEFAGRIDTQVKIRGFRIEPGEIEAALLALPEVVSAAVVARPHRGQARLVAYLVAETGRAPLTGIALKQRLAERLPDAMIPQAFVWLDALPVTRNAKLDAAALPEPDAEAEGQGSFVAPTNDVERGLQEIWQDLLAKASIGIDDNFFELGGHSLTALRLVAACQARLGLDLPVTAVFAHQTIRALASSAGSDASSEPLLTLRDGGTRPPLFCVHPVGGSALVYRPLAAALGDDQPVHGLHALGRTPTESLETMARTYVEAIRRVQPNGPYHLLGHSFGGLLAFEMARRLEAEGETVAELAMLDTSIPHEAAPDVDDETILRLLSAETDPSAIVGLVGKLQADITRLVRAHIRLSAGYAPVSLAAPLTYVRALGDGRRDGRERFWTAFSRQPRRVVDLPCGHFDMLSPEPAEALAQHLRRASAASFEPESPTRNVVECDQAFGKRPVMAAFCQGGRIG